MNRIPSISFSQTDKLSLPSLQSQSKNSLYRYKTTGFSSTNPELEKKQKELKKYQKLQKQLNKKRTILHNTINENNKNIYALESRYDADELVRKKKKTDFELTEQKKLDLLKKTQKIKNELFESESSLAKLSMETELLRAFKGEKGEILRQLIKEFRLAKQVVAKNPSNEFFNPPNQFSSNKKKMFSSNKKHLFSTNKKKLFSTNKENLFSSNKDYKKSQFYNIDKSNKVSHFNGNRLVNKFCQEFSLWISKPQFPLSK